jgi:hypothetical protein
MLPCYPIVELDQQVVNSLDHFGSREDDGDAAAHIDPMDFNSGQGIQPQLWIFEIDDPENPT